MGDQQITEEGQEDQFEPAQNCRYDCVAPFAVPTERRDR
jgi:hypothetical protein